MKKINILTVLVILFFSIGLNAQDTVSYWGFEDGTTFGPNGSNWNNTGTTWIHEIISEDEANAYDGTAYFKAEVAEESPNSWDNQAVYQEIPVSNNTSYRFSMMIKAESTGDFDPSVNLTAGTYNGWSEIAANYGAAASTEWKKVILMLAVEDTEDLDLIDENGRYEDTVRFPISYPIPGTYFVDDVTILKSTIAGITYNGNAIEVDFGYGLDFIASISPDAFTISVDDNFISATSAVMKLNEAGTSYEPKIYLKLETEIQEGATVSLDYTGEEDLYYASVGPVTPDSKAAEFEAEVALFDANVEIHGPTSLINNESNTTINLFPNPVINTLNISSNHTISDVQVINIAGKVIMQFKPNTMSTKLDLSELTKGLYMVQITDVNGIATASKLLK